MTDWAVRVVERDGTPVRTLVDANVLGYGERVNGEVPIEFSYPKHDPATAPGQAADVRAITREVQVLRDGQVVAWGVPLHKTKSSATGDVKATAPGLPWWFTRRDISGPIRNRLVNPGFETGSLSPWAVSGAGVTATVVTSPRRLGANAVRLVNTTTGADRFLKQDIVGVAGGAIGVYLTLAAHFRIASWTGPALQARGLYIEAQEASVVQQVAFVEIDDATPVGVWQRAQTGLWVPPGETWDLNARLYAPNADITYDATVLVSMDSLAASVAGDDIAAMAGAVALFVQDPANGYDDLNIGVSTPAAGVLVSFPKAWQYADHTPADRAISGELAPLGFDWSIEYDDLGGGVWSKTFTTHAPRMGVDRTGTVTLELDVNVASYTLDEDGSAVEDDVIILGDGDGPDREEGRATDTSELDGVVLRGIQPAPVGTTIDMLDPLAADRLSRSKRLVRLLTLVVHQKAGDLIGLLRAGDTVHVVIDDGDAQVDGDFRIVERKVSPGSETMALTLNEDFGARGGLQRPDQVAGVARANTRLTDLERRTTPTDRPVVEEVAVFSFPAELFAKVSGLWPVRTGGQLVEVTLKLRVAGTTSTTIKVLHGGVQIGSTITLAAGVTAPPGVYLGAFRIPAGDTLQSEIVTAGTGAQDLTVAARMKG